MDPEVVNIVNIFDLFYFNQMHSSSLTESDTFCFVSLKYFGS